MEINFELDKWNAFLESKGLNHYTIKKYSMHAKRFDCSQLSQDYLIDYIKKNNNLGARAFIKNLFEYLKLGATREFKLELADLTLPKITGRGKKKLPEILNEQEIFELSDSMTRERDRILTLLYFYTGARISELIPNEFANGIKPYDFAWEQWLDNPEKVGRLKLTGKGNKQRIVFVPSKLMARIYDWIKKEVVPMGRAREQPLFNIGNRYFEKLIKDKSFKVLGREIHPHLLRHSCGSWLRSKGFDLKEIADLLGHESISTTEIYTQIDKGVLQSKYEQMLKREANSN